MRARLLVLLGAMALLLGPTEGLTQFQGGGGGQMRLGGGGRPDPGQSFDQMSGGKAGLTKFLGGGGRQLRLGRGGLHDHAQSYDQIGGVNAVLTRNDVANAGVQGMFERLVPRVRAANHELTRDQYIQASQQMMAQWDG